MPICPLLKDECLKEECAWYLEDTGCAIWVLAWIEDYRKSGSSFPSQI